MIDLHAHTTASDGSFSPRELVEHAKEKGLKAVGITDHDTFGGWDEALKAGEELGVEVVTGIELSVAGDLGKFHLLGYGVKRDSKLAQTLQTIQDERDKRNHIIIENLNRLPEIEAKGGVSFEEVKAVAGNGVMGRPHFARVLIEKGIVATTQEAFDKFLADGAAAHASKQVLEPQIAVELIHDAGGVAVWAHPTRPPSSRAEVSSYEEWETVLQQWISWGLDGLEIYYSAYTEEEAAWTKAMAEKYNLLAMGGSDFHGLTKPTVQLGVVQGGQSVPDEVLENLKKVLSAER